MTVQPLEISLGLLAAALVYQGLSQRWRQHRLERWLQQGADKAAPELWGRQARLAERIERALRERERQARDEQQRLAQFLDALEVHPNGLLLLDPQDQVRWFNTAAAQHLGLDPARDQLQNLRNLVRAPIFVALLSGGRDSDQAQFAWNHRQLLVLSRRFGLQSPNPMTLLVTQDVTERTQLERMRRDFVANVSHEVRSPLTVIAGFVETLQTLALTPKEQQHALGLMRQQTDRMQALVADLLTLARLENTPAASLSEAWVDLRALLERCHQHAEVADQGHHALPIRGLETAAGWSLKGQESDWHSALSNLLGNAVRYTPAGGTVELHWTPPDASGWASIAVRDNGIGIAAEHLPRLTERFYRVDASRSRDTGGTGLGLAIVKHVLQQHGAELAIESEPGRGSCFTLRLPLSCLRRTEA
ncbi:phosphate regulon sensor histidine kinase PhoR [Inhella gelatinilytica]|uniref:Phosphate regulon sensor protein PhoR n=1 Tax=Inhella gelatinilytica TaxID=2795030 RepID=A0A931J261_9BURK|nr:phosphate regulon sensor histidine kinase PhoR [Inhella gelatinilytica]MBH9554108.1 phosphate regulon sensor histidine kinase PhoR [Inhella gelatinilytica]